MSAPHVVILASAGTGKTYQLSGRFIDLLLAGAAQERILATTFTRKAAGEILERVLERLIEAVDSPAERAALAEGRAFGGTFDGEQAQRLLERLAGRLQRFEVRTIDSFFVTLCQVFGTDLDLAPTWALADEYALSALREEALSRVLAEADEQDFADLLRELSAKGAAARRVRATLAEVIKGGRALFLESPAQAWWRVEPPGEPEGLAEALAALEGADLPRTQAGGVMKSWAGARERLVAHAREGSWLEAVKGGFLQKYLAGEECFDKKPIPATLVPVLDVLREAAAHALLTRLDERNRRSRELLERYERVLRALKRERGAYAFDDLPRALAPIETGASGPIEERDLDLSLRLDARIDHLLLDEFQDTAPVQWRVLGPMAEELAADGTGGRSLFCVGDVKQSIYGWRAAEPRLLEALGDALHIEPTRLALNYRSSPVVLGALGRVFGSLGENAALAADGPGPLMLAAERFTATFEEPRAARTLPGAVELREAGGGRARGLEGEPTLGDRPRRGARGGHGGCPARGHHCRPRPQPQADPRLDRCPAAQGAARQRRGRQPARGLGGGAARALAPAPRRPPFRSSGGLPPDELSLRGSPG